MSDELLKIVGDGKHKILVLDDFLDNPEEVIEAACDIAPFELAPKSTYYPGIRKYILPNMVGARAYVDVIGEALLPIMAHFYGAKSIEIDEPSFSMVTYKKSELSQIQTVPHFDDLDENFFAILHYLSPSHNSGTSLYRHKETGIEKITLQNRDKYIETLSRQLSQKSRPQKYMLGSDELFQEIYNIEGKFNRIAIYQGSILHSGNIAPNENLSSNPKEGRLTANIFVRIKR